MRSMVEGHALRKPPVPFHHPSGGPPPPAGEEREWVGPLIDLVWATSYGPLTNEGQEYAS